MLRFNVLFNHKNDKLELPESSTVQQVKCELAKITCIPVSDQVLMYGTELDDKSTLGECDIQNEAQLHVYSRSRAKNYGEYHSTVKRAARAVNTLEDWRKDNPLGNKHVVLDTYPNPDQALEILKKFARDIATIIVMNRRGWRVDRLCELDPVKEETVLGNNTKTEISLRLRNRNGSFLTYDEIQDTMYHELAHCEISAHIPEFFELMSTIKKECEEIREKGMARILGSLSISPSSPSSSIPTIPPSTSPFSKPNKHFPASVMTTYDRFQFGEMHKKILEFNSVVEDKMDENDMKLLHNLLEVLKDTSYYHVSKVEEAQIRLVVRLLSWPVDKLLPILDLIRLILTHPRGSELLFAICPTIVETIIALSDIVSENRTLYMLSIRCIANMFKNKTNRKFIQAQEEKILNLLSESAIIPNKEICHATASVLLNLSVMYRSQTTPTGKSKCVQIIYTLLNSLLSNPLFANLLLPLPPSIQPRPQLVPQPSYSYAILTTLSTLGTLIYYDSKAISAAKELRIFELVQKATITNDPNIKECAELLLLVGGHAK